MKGIREQTDPLVVHSSAFEGLSPTERQKTEDVINEINAKLATGEFTDTPRKIIYTKISDEHILNYLLAKNVIFYIVHDPRGFKMLYC